MLEQVNYDVLDQAKAAFIEASKKTLGFASSYGFVPNDRLGASANIFALDLKPFIKQGAEKLFITLIPEGLGTADDARPDDLTEDELTTFWHNIAFKTLSALTNDAASGGLQTVLISLYLPSSTPERVFNKPFLDGFLNGFVAGCKTVGCVWISGETPQLKGKIYDDKLDIAGALFAMTPPGILPIDSTKLAEGNKIVLISSSGPHENGFTTLRRIATQLPDGYRTKLPDGQEFWQAINAPSILYTPFVQSLLAANLGVTGIENITGHGWQKMMRSNKPLKYVIKQMLPVPPVFSFIEEKTKTSAAAMIKIFNYGTGLAIYLDSDESASQAVNIAKQHNLNAIVAGEIVKAEKRQIIVEPLQIKLTDESFALKRD
jgi:phosphoribosylformylglycinamidine cyclo-ligase